jgi:protein-tyrosine phosphatase family protein
VIDEDIIHDYTLSAPFMPEIRDRTRNDPAVSPEAKELPDFQWEASAESMARFLALLRREYGSAAGYLKAQTIGCSSGWKRLCWSSGPSDVANAPRWTPNKGMQATATASAPASLPLFAAPDAWRWADQTSRPQRTRAAGIQLGSHA